MTDHRRPYFLRDGTGVPDPTTIDQRLRPGQAFMASLSRDEYDAITGTDADPFYLDERLPAAREFIRLFRERRDSDGVRE